MSNCSKYGKKYESQIYNIVKKCKLNGINFNTQDEKELGGCGSKNDIECNMNSQRDIPIEIKKMKTPDWMQCSLKYENNRWIGSLKNKIPEKSKKIFEEIISNIQLFNNQIPPFMVKNITHKEWVKIKHETTDFNDTYIDCPSDTIKKLYTEKGCAYIQISNKGLYHIGNDLCMFNVPEFICEQQLRIRTKIHKRNDSNGYCKLSVTVSCQPKNIKKLIDSNFSLDDISKLPINLIYNSSNPIQNLNWELCIHNTNTKENNIEMQEKNKEQPEVKLNNLSRDKLIQLCKERKIKGYSKLKKQEIIDLLSQNNLQPEVKLNNLSRDKLIQLCKERKIKGYSKLKKQEIIDLMI